MISSAKKLRFLAEKKVSTTFYQSFFRLRFPFEIVKEYPPQPFSFSLINGLSIYNTPMTFILKYLFWSFGYIWIPFHSKSFGFLVQVYLLLRVRCYVQKICICILSGTPKFQKGTTTTTLREGIFENLADSSSY